MLECPYKETKRMGVKSWTGTRDSYHSVNATHALEVVLGQLAKTNGLKEVLLPALLTAINTDGHVALLADSAAEAAGLVASGEMGQGISQVVELATIKELLGHVVLEPEGLGDLHLNAHLTADILEELVLGVVDLLGLLVRAVVEPEDDVAVLAVILKFGTGNSDGLVSVCGEDGEGACGIETNALDLVSADTSLGYHAANALADTLPNVGCGLFLCVTVRNQAKPNEGISMVTWTYIVALLGLPQLDVLGGQSLDISRLIDDTRTGRSCANIDANEMVLQGGVPQNVSFRHPGLRHILGNTGGGNPQSAGLG